MVWQAVKLATERSSFAENKLNITGWNTSGSTAVTLYGLNHDDNTLRKRWHVPLKAAGFATYSSY
jgi:hypothetical protein